MKTFLVLLALAAVAADATEVPGHLRIFAGDSAEMVAKTGCVFTVDFTDIDVIMRAN